MIRLEDGDVVPVCIEIFTTEQGVSMVVRWLAHGGPTPGDET